MGTIAAATRLPTCDADTTAAVLAEFVELSLGRCLLGRRGPAPQEALDLLEAVPLGASPAEAAARLAAADRDLITARTTLPPPLAEIAGVFRLSPVELRLLCLVLAPELDGRHATVIGLLQGDPARRRPGLTLLAELSPPGVDVWELRRTVGAPGSVVSAGLIRTVGRDELTVDDGFAPAAAVVARLLASSVGEAVARVGARLARPRPLDQPPPSAEETEAALRLRRHPGGQPFQLTGPGSCGDWFPRLAAAAGLPLVIADGGRAGPDAVPEWVVLARVAGAGLLVTGMSTLGRPEQQALADRLADAARDLRVVASDGEPRPGGGPVLSAPPVTAVQRAAWWTWAADRNGFPLSTGDARRLAGTTPLEPGLIERTITTARALAGEQPAVAVVKQAAGESLAATLPTGVRRITPVHDWDDLVLPPARKDLLRTIPLHVLHAGQVLEEWGFGKRMPYGQGVTALFTGPSGTGKTMAAQVVANALGVGLLQVDLSRTVSKYIGETEKNLEAVFTAAEECGAVLLFDEADAVFGRRTEIQDAHDRYANAEVAYLLQRIESFRGLAVLTTNLRQGIDDAFLRRLRFVVEFPLPGPAERQLIWDRVFPPGTPVQPGLDVATLARRLPLSGGSVQSIALHAAFLAAADGGTVGRTHLLAAARRELLKIGMHTAERDLATVTP